MKSTPRIIEQLLKLANGPKIIAEIENRRIAVGRTSHDLSKSSGVSVATLWRMKNSTRITKLDALYKVDKTLRKWERGLI